MKKMWKQWIRPPSISETEEVDSVLRTEFERMQRAEPETVLQWQQLQRTLSAQRATVSRRLVPRLAFGILGVAAVAIGVIFYLTPNATGPEAFVTRRGEQTRVVLPDSSEVTMNYATQLVVATMEDGKLRQLSLKGEAFFRVRKNETPFIVSTEFGHVEVIGTEFNVRARDEVLEVAVIRGTVRLLSSQNGQTGELTLSRGERAICARDSLPHMTGNVPSQDYPGWMHGKLFFDKATIADACREIEMRFDAAIRIQDTNVGGEVVSGILHAPNAESAVASLCRLTKKNFRNDQHGFTIY